MDIAKEQVLEIVKEELELLEGQQAFIAYAHLRAYDKDTLNEGLEDIFSFNCIFFFLTMNHPLFQNLD